MSDSILYDIAADLLAEAVAGIDSPPDRQVIVPGPDFAHDCDMVAVELRSMYSARMRSTSTADRPVARNENETHTRQAQYQVTLVLKCIPAVEGSLNSIKLPDPSAISAAAERVMSDGYGARKGVRDAIAAGTILLSCQHASVGDLVPFGPSGGVAGVRFPVLVELP